MEVLRKGGTILYPTDTIWGIGCDATNVKAVEKIFEIKKREERKSLIILVSDEKMLNRFVKEVPSIAWDLIEQSESALTIIYDEGINLAKIVLAEDGSIAIRIVKHEFCNKLIYKFGKPVVSTSANLGGEKAPDNFSEVKPEIISQADYVVNLNRKENKISKPSSIIKVKNNGEIKIIRR